MTAPDRRSAGTTPDAGTPPTRPADGESDSFDVDPDSPDIEDLLTKLDALSDAVDDPYEREQVRQTISLVEQMPGTTAFAERITKYTSRDVAESFVGATIFALPLLVEGGVFEIAAWFAATTVVGVPVLLVAHVGFIFAAVAGLLYVVDLREIETRHQIFGFIPRRYAGVLLASLATSAGLLLFWGRLHEGDPTPLEQAGRIAVIWAAAAFGASLGDILPGESKGSDIGPLGFDPFEADDRERDGRRSDDRDRTD